MFGAPSTSNVVRNLIVACVVGFVLQILSETGPLRGVLESWGALVPFEVWGRGQVWRLFSYMFLHGSFLHLLFNMLGLWMFGQAVANQMGDRKFLGLFLFSGITAGLFSGLFYLLDGSAHVPVIGASGALYGVMLAFARFFPNAPVILLIFPVPARIAVWIFGAIAFFSSVRGDGNVAHLTHLFGLLGAWLFLRFEEPVEMWISGMMRRNERKRVQQAAEVLVDREEFFDTRVDPILKKISKHGIDSLSRQERSILEKASGIKKGSENLVDLKAWKHERGR